MLFISHSTKDKDAALDLQRRLLERGYACEQHFLDSDQRSGIKLGERWEQIIYDNLRDCRAMLILCSPNWLESKWCFAELAAAKMSGKQVFPMVLADSDRSSLGEYQAAFINQPDPAAREEAFERLFLDLESRGLGPKDHLPWPNKDLKADDGQIDNCPFPGLLAFDERYAGVYFGREPETLTVLEELRKMQSSGEPRLLMIVGSSGSGKSSLLKAGVLPRLKHPTEARRWLVLPTLRYGESPSEEHTVFDQLARDLAAMFPAEARNAPDWKALRDQFSRDDAEQAAKAFLETTQDLTSARRCPDATVLLPIDQFEELLTPASGPFAPKFLRFLQAAFGRRNGRLLAVGTIRSDYVDVYERNPHALSSPIFKDWRLGPFPRERIVDVIKKPADRAHVDITVELLEGLKRDTPTAEALPLLAFTLEKLYRRHAGDGKLELPEYVDLGGMEGAIQKSVGRVVLLQSLSANDRDALRLSFVKHLSQVNEKDEIVRRMARWSDLPAEARPLLEQFVADRLLVRSDRDGVEVAHEAMFRCWDDLKEWLRTSGDILRWRRDVERDRASDQTRWSGLRPAQLAVAREWPKHRHNELKPEEMEWIRTGISRERLGRFIRRGVMAVIGGLACLFLWQMFEARRSERKANNNLTEANFALGRVSYEKQDFDAMLLWWTKAWLTAEHSSLRPTLRKLIAAWAPRERRLIHDGPVNEVAFSRDGSIVLTWCDRKTATLWDAATGVPRGEPLTHDGGFASVAFSLDGETVITWRREAQLWDARTGAPRGKPLTHTGPVSCVALSPDGQTVLTGGHDKTAKLWDARTGAPLSVVLTHGDLVHSVAFSPDGEILITGSHDKSAQMWDARTGAPRGQPLMHQGSVSFVAFSPGGQTVLTISEGEKPTVRFWDARTGTSWGEALTLVYSNDIVQFSPDNQTVLMASGKSARLRDVRTGEPRGEPLTHSDVIQSVAFSPDGQMVVTGSEDKTAQLWDGKSGAPLGEPLLHADAVFSVAFNPSSQVVLTGSRDKTARLWNIQTDASPREQVAHSKAIQSVAFSPDGQTVVTASYDKTAQLWDARTGAPLGAALMHGDLVYSAAFSPDGETVITGSQDKTARLWNARTGAPQGGPLAHAGYVYAVAFSPDGQTAFTGSRDKTARFWETRTGALRGDPLLHENEVDSVAFSPNGKTVITGSADSTARLWDVQTSTPFGEPMRHGGSVYSVAFSPDGETVLTGSSDCTARLWDARTGAPRGEPLMHAGVVYSVAFSPDGETVLTGSADKSARLWDARTGSPRGAPLTHAGIVYAVAFSPDGQTVLTGNEDKTARFWPVPVPAIDDRARPERWKSSIEVATGKRLDENGVLQEMSFSEWRARQQELDNLGGPWSRPTWDEYNAWKHKQ